ncbi:hypothetical protein [Hymenobacter properus]|uniref:Uncharacterized protein n=1 Tax=Hymenobacter properus TaxID=2791026 RepID=A0A931BL38_9BACT|nr:hypothetical protein [Hymenobacter properus]MBF9141445.1 hypothetical protein [Hymenobacter properus]MBR7720254.1 hypothetical protein [Microvirga sp. SRT04]
MKKMLFSAAALLCTVAAMAQAPASASHAVKPATTRQHDADDERDGKAGAPANHGQTVSNVAQTTTLTGADKGAAVSAVARSGRGVDHATRSARGEHSHAGGGHLGGGHSAGSHGGGRGHGH